MPRLTIMNKPYNDEQALANVVSYVMKSGLRGGVAVDPEHAVEQMMLVKTLWHKTDGRQVRHFFLSFADHEEVEICEAMELGYRIAEYYGARFQIVFGLHLDTYHIHLHFAFNTVSYIDGKMYSEGYGDWNRFRDYVQTLFPKWSVELATSTGESRGAAANREEFRMY